MLAKPLHLLETNLSVAQRKHMIYLEAGKLYLSPTNVSKVYRIDIVPGLNQHLL